MPSLSMIAAYGAALVLTLILAAWLTPRAWWRRPNARALAVLAGGTVALGALLHGLPGTTATVHAAALPKAAAEVPVAAARYRARDNVNLRAGVGVNAPRLGVVPGGAQVTASGRHQGDWWQVSAVVDGRRQQGWASSLWLRRTDEGQRR
jgi:hypothetical protein